MLFKFGNEIIEKLEQITLVLKLEQITLVLIDKTKICYIIKLTLYNIGYAKVRGVVLCRQKQNTQGKRLLKKHLK